MYICICKAITQKQIEEKMLQNGGNVSLTLRSLGVGSECGVCVQDAVSEVKKRYEQLKSQSKHSHSGKSNL